MKRLIIAFVSCLLLMIVPNYEASAANPNYDRLKPIAKKYVGVPYRWGGTTPRGFDCSGYITTVYREVGVSLPRTSNSMYRTGSAVSKNNLQVGDLVFFNTSGRGVSHVGIYVGSNQFMHASTSRGVIVSNLSESYYRTRYVGAKRVLSHYGQPGQFRDIPSNHWVAPAATQLGKNNIIIGYADGTFRPNDTIRRDDVAAILAEVFKLNMNNRSQKFRDISSSYWSVGAINAVANKNIFQGSGNQFRPHDGLTRGQMAAILTRAFNLKGSTGQEFTDVPTSHWAYKDIQALAASGITTGKDDGSFQPEERVTRGQFITFLQRAL
ncbi:hypothetical protein J2S13_002335 [Oikeobacillus pervagus]|uniref:Hydrolase Nlp/P60 n=1 Tax=Oikeobacillus pervagus TaxID=1325931 RepID=A0AAJ1T7A5_9BACI|nr:C40 family peptidase [Oikeobacillus pervagus]MDQ0215915.1 hypothetical protein [Oikeobacillus pervagus]